MLHPYFDSVIPVVFYTAKISIFQDSFCFSFFLRFYATAFKNPLYVFEKAFCKISKHFLAINYFCKTSTYLSRYLAGSWMHLWLHEFKCTLLEHCPHLEFSPHSDWVWRDMEYLSKFIHSKCGKILTRETPNTDIFHAVIGWNYNTTRNNIKENLFIKVYWIRHTFEVERNSF